VSQENLEAVRRGYEAFNRGDVDAVLEGVDPEVEWHVPPVLPDPATYHGREGVRKLMQTMQDAFDDFELAVEEVREAGDKVVVMAAVRGRGKESGAVVESPSFGWVWTIRHGKVVLVEVYPNRAATFEAVGLNLET
jgi:ketosteroid isomerase-like protein